jgi:hypothetical protein
VSLPTQKKVLENIWSLVDFVNIDLSAAYVFSFGVRFLVFSNGCKSAVRVTIAVVSNFSWCSKNTINPSNKKKKPTKERKKRTK